MIIIDGLLFDNKIGEILVPEPDAIPFRNSTAVGVGIQVTAARGPGFTLTLTRYDEPASLQAVRNSIRSRIGKRVRITDYYHNLTIRYTEPIHGQYEFMVTQARVVQARNIAAWQGFRLTGTMEKHEPADQDRFAVDDVRCRDAGFVLVATKTINLNHATQRPRHARVSCLYQGELDRSVFSTRRCVGRRSRLERRPKRIDCDTALSIW